MLVLNRRPGEAIVIEPDFRVTVLSVTDRRVWIGLRSSGPLPELRVSATVVSPDEARLEIVPMSSVVFEDGRVRIAAPAEDDPATAARAGLAVDRKPGERVEIGEDLWVAIASISKGNPCVTFGGKAIGDPFSITLIRPAGSYVRLGVDAPNRRVYREELWDVVQAGEAKERRDDGLRAHAADGVTADMPLLDPAAPLLDPAAPLLDPAAPLLDPAAPLLEASDVTAGSATG
jgi:sRNA-binding carbon storage regulator CsrA